MPEDKIAKYTAPALEKGLDILELLSTEEAGLVHQLAEDLLRRACAAVGLHFDSRRVRTPRANVTVWVVAKPPC